MYFSLPPDDTDVHSFLLLGMILIGPLSSTYCRCTAGQPCRHLDMASTGAKEFPKDVGGAEANVAAPWATLRSSILRMDEKDGTFSPRIKKSGNTGKLPSSLALTIVGSAPSDLKVASWKSSNINRTSLGPLPLVDK